MATPATDELSAGEYDAEQIRLMAEECLVVDDDDKVIGSDTKKNCHLMTNIDKGLLHRAFSVFLFNSKGELMLQQRADEKITFPGYWTNTCCSHPLNRPEEIVEADQQGVRQAAQRKLDHELGITADQVPIDGFNFMTRIHYKAPSDGKWGEHEIDYVLFMQKDVTVKPNPNEVQAIKYFSKEDMKAFLASAEKEGLKITPWFRLIVENFLYKWWDNLATPDTSEREVIHRL